jgi:hypothetical protein
VAIELVHYIMIKEDICTEGKVLELANAPRARESVLR